MLEFQVHLLTIWLDLASGARRRVASARADLERGEVTATTAIIVILVVAAIAAGGVIAGKIKANADKVPSP